MSERALVVIPALNAARSIGPIVESCVRYVADVVVVDDGSSDDTGDRARARGATVLRHEVNRRKGAALKTGFAHALGNGFDVVITLDADGQHLPEEIPKFLASREQTGGDLVIGSRSHLFDQMVGRRRMANRFSSAMISWAAGAKVDDTQSGFRLYSGKLLRGLTIRADGFDAESEVIVRAGRGGYRIVMLPIGLGFVDGLSTSHYKAVRDSLRIARTVARVRFLG